MTNNIYIIFIGNTVLKVFRNKEDAEYFVKHLKTDIPTYIEEYVVE